MTNSVRRRQYKFIANYISYLLLIQTIGCAWKYRHPHCREVCSHNVEEEYFDRCHKRCQERMREVPSP